RHAEAEDQPHEDHQDDPHVPGDLSHFPVSPSAAANAGSSFSGANAGSLRTSAALKPDSGAARSRAFPSASSAPALSPFAMATLACPYAHRGDFGCAFSSSANASAAWSGWWDARNASPRV